MHKFEMDCFVSMRLKVYDTALYSAVIIYVTIIDFDVNPR